MKDSLSFWCFVFLLHCLIYKVQTAHSRRSFILTHRFEPVKYFFQLFFAVSLARVVPALRVSSTVIQQPVSCELLYLTTPFRVCQELFSALSELSARFRSLSSRPSGAQLIYQTGGALSTLFFVFSLLFFAGPRHPQHLGCLSLTIHYFCPSPSPGSLPLSQPPPFPHPGKPPETSPVRQKNSTATTRTSPDQNTAPHIFRGRRGVPARR